MSACIVVFYWSSVAYEMCYLYCSIMHLIAHSTVYLAAQITVISESFGACLIWLVWTLFVSIVMNSFVDTSATLMNGRTLYFTVIIMYDLFYFIFILSRISFHVVVLVCCQMYMFLFRCFYIICMYVSVLLSIFCCLMANKHYYREKAYNRSTGIAGYGTPIL